MIVLTPSSETTPAPEYEYPLSLDDIQAVDGVYACTDHDGCRVIVIDKMVLFYYPRYYVGPSLRKYIPGTARLKYRLTDEKVIFGIQS